MTYLFALLMILLTPVNVLAQASDNVGDELGEPTLFENWQFFLAFILPLAIAFIIKRDWTQQQKALVSFGISAVCALIGMLIAGSLPINADIQVKIIMSLTTILKVFVLTIPIYYGLWKQVGTTAAIHNATG